ncbi:meiosis protein SPO22/ZIP4 like-domain-containing protein [Dichomitus squalens]|uniref:Protein ZIP4 homolog n=1 Tax=Dichomitus squalens TaxID=114155 RepID=A0A4Q9MI63_9APHY|nr:meiosis protein SPO22/ZIP4 like-domain-containing protein [Dichomitus squalens]
MAGRRKRKSSSDAQTAYTDIQSTLASIKAKLNGKQPDRNSIRTDLLRLAAFADSLSVHRPRANKEWSHRIDELDGEGVALWNASLVQRNDLDDTYRSFCAALRLAAFRLIEAGIEDKPSIECMESISPNMSHICTLSPPFPLALIHVLQLASKVGASLADVGDSDLAASVLASAAKYEELLRAAEDPQNEHAQGIARAVVLYYSSRMEAAWREGNAGVAEFMLEKVTENDQRLSLLTPSDRRTLAGKLLVIGKGVLQFNSQDNTAGNGAKDAVKWLQRAFAIIEPLEDAADPGEGQLKRSILRTLCRAYFLASSQDPEHLARAEASLQELIDSANISLDHTSAEYQQLRWMRVAILKRRKAAHTPLLEAFRAIIDHMEFSENNITDILQELRSLGHDHALVILVHLHCLQQALEARNSAGLVYLDRILLSLIFHSTKDSSHMKAMQDVTTALDLLDNKEFMLPKVPTTACLTLFWQFGDRHYRAKRWSEAADWFLAGTHGVFGSMSKVSDPKCLRKAALCYIQCGEHARASAVIRRCPSQDAATHYVALLAAVRQGLQDEAVTAVHEMVHASNFNKKMLLLATRLANETGMKHLLLSVLEALLDASLRDGLENQGEAVTLVRCIIRLVLRMMSEPGSNFAIFIPMLMRHFSTSLSLVTALQSNLNTAVDRRDISWLWRTAYNAAVQGCAEWEDHENTISDLFDIARQLLESYMNFPAVDAEMGLHVFLINASFAGAVGRVFTYRHEVTSDAAEEVWQFCMRSFPSADGTNVICAKTERRKGIGQIITMSKDRIQKVLRIVDALREEEIQRAHSFLNVLSVFETEIACHTKSWSRISEVIEETARIPLVDLGTFEAIADTLWVEKDCPVEVLLAALEAILHASLDRAALSVEKFSRWLRAICTILLSRNSAADRAKAIGYVEQAVDVLQEHGGMDDSQAYPVDERHWLMGTVYNTGIECLHASLLDEAKRWFEAAATICRFVPDGDARADRVRPIFISGKTEYVLMEAFLRSLRLTPHFLLVSAASSVLNSGAKFSLLPKTFWWLNPGTIGLALAPGMVWETSALVLDGSGSRLSHCSGHVSISY